MNEKPKWRKCVQLMRGHNLQVNSDRGWTKGKSLMAEHKCKRINEYNTLMKLCSSSQNSSQ